MPDPDYHPDPEHIEEIERVCGDFDFDAEDRSYERELLRRLVTFGRTTREEICLHVLKTVLVGEKPLDSQIQQANRLIRRTRTLLEKMYRRPGLNTRPVTAILERGTRGTNVYLTFTKNTARKPRAMAGTGPRSAVRDAAHGLWACVIQAAQVRRVLVIYDTPKLGLKNAACDGRGDWAGSGEVAAAFIIAARLSDLRPRVSFKIKRWRDVEDVDLTGERQCVIVLGSSIGSYWMRRLREREAWIGQQKFHFEPSTIDGSDGCIQCGSLVGPGSRRGRRHHHRRATVSTEGIDYSLVSFLRDDANQLLLFTFQGVSSAGTLAAAQYVCSPKTAADLTTRLREDHGIYLDKGQKLPGFELLLKVDLKDCAPVGSQHLELVLH